MASTPAQLEYPGAAWTAFDRYSRYGAVARAMRASLGPGRWRVLDVGDGAGYLRAFDSDIDSVVVDPCPTPEPLPGTVRVVGDGSALPWPAGTFDAVVSCDSLEHVPPPARDAFVAELARVSRDVVVVAAPFDSPGVSGAEELVRRFALLVTGRPQDQLEEHAEHGLPELARVEAALGAATGGQVAVAGSGNLLDWVQMMLLKHQLMARPALAPLESGYDIAYNHMLAGRDSVGPFYRHLLVSRRSGPPQVGAAPGAGGGPDGACISGLLATFAAANVAEAVRQDTERRVLDIEGAIERLDRSVTPVLASLPEVLARIEASAKATEERVGRLSRALRHPLQSAGRIARSGRSPRPEGD